MSQMFKVSKIKYSENAVLFIGHNIIKKSVQMTWNDLKHIQCDDMCPYLGSDAKVNNT